MQEQFLSSAGKYKDTSRLSTNTQKKNNSSYEDIRNEKSRWLENYFFL